MVDIKTIRPEELAKLHDEKGIHLIDVGTPAEFREIHAPIAVNIPLNTLNAEHVKRTQNGSETELVYVICQRGKRSSRACLKLMKAGITNVVSVEGGTTAWAQKGLPVNRGKKTFALERQVRIAAGFLVLTGALLGMFVNPWFSGLAAFVGAGLMFAGITDTCGMAMVLAKMPWNQVHDSEKKQRSV